MWRKIWYKQTFLMKLEAITPGSLMLRTLLSTGCLSLGCGVLFHTNTDPTILK